MQIQYLAASGFVHMKISGFTMVRNAVKLYYPVREAILSILPVVDEFVVALGDCDADDTTQEQIKSIGSDKVRIIHTVWDIESYPRGMEHAHQTDIAREACTGDWLFYLQADEVVHEKYLPHIVDQCRLYRDDQRVEGFLFDYIHFYGDYWHHIDYHGWYPEEIRIVRNDPDIHSFASAQSFRRIPHFDGKSYRDKEGTFKLQVKKIDAAIYHYGWVRPPSLMQRKSKSFHAIHKGTAHAEQIYQERSESFDYGNMNRCRRFNGTHPAVMKHVIEKFDWGDALHFERGYTPARPKMKHEKLKYRILSFIERHFFGGRPLFGYSNWKRLP